jgi:hypothetical protein
MLWDHFKPYLERATERAGFEAGQINEAAREQVRDGRLMLVHIFDALETQAVAACELVELNDGRSLHVRWLSGSNIEGWIDEIHEGLRTLANANNCKWVTLNGRLGWRKLLKSHGMTPVAITLRAEVY